VIHVLVVGIVTVGGVEVTGVDGGVTTGVVHVVESVHELLVVHVVIIVHVVIGGSTGSMEGIVVLLL